jgi:hypothetical protein
MFRATLRGEGQNLMATKQQLKVEPDAIGEKLLTLRTAAESSAEASPRRNSR